MSKDAQSGPDGAVGMRMVDRYGADQQKALELENARTYLSSAFIQRNMPDDELVSNTLEWLIESRDFFEKYPDKVPAADLMLYNMEIDTLKGYRNVSNAQEVFDLVKKIFQRLYKELNLRATMIPQPNPFRKGGEQRLPAAGQVSNSKPAASPYGRKDPRS